MPFSDGFTESIGPIFRASVRFRRRMAVAMVVAMVTGMGVLVLAGGFILLVDPSLLLQDLQASRMEGTGARRPGCLDTGGTLCRDESNTSAGLNGDPLIPARCCGRSHCIREQTPDARIYHRERPKGGSLVGSVGSN